jgi:hypothetical protein
MPLIFPGMDPYLERPDLWPDVHDSLVFCIREQLQARLRERYHATIVERVYIEERNQERIVDVGIRRASPRRSSRGRAAAAAVVAELDEPLRINVAGVEIHESFITIRSKESGRRIVAVIEVVSPANKRPGPGRRLYQEKQRELIDSNSHLIEIDLLRRGRHVVAVPAAAVRAQSDYDYLISIHRGGDEAGLTFLVYPIGVRDRLPRVRVPLAGDDYVPLDLRAALERTYEAAAYGDVIDYTKPCRPPLSPEDQAWADRQIKAPLKARR